MAVQSELHDFMLKHTPQREWIDGRGVALWLAFFFSEIGAGIYFVSLFFESPRARLSGWLISLVLGGLFHMAYLGKPSRGWRILLHASGSELSRGLWVLLFFAVIGFFQVVPVVVTDLPWAGSHLILKIPMSILCVLVMAHGFMTMGAVRALPAWGSGMLIPLSVISGTWVGAQFVQSAWRLGGHDAMVIEGWSLWLLFSYAGALGLHLWSIMHSGQTARSSGRRILSGDLSRTFYIGVAAIGIVVPLIITLALRSADHTGSGIILLRFVCVLVGDLAMRYTLMKDALYAPLV